MVYNPKTNDIIDKEYKDLCAEMYSEGHSFFTYISDSVDSLASCCYSKNTKVLIKDSDGVHMIPFEEVESIKKDYLIFSNGSWKKGKLVVIPNRPDSMYRVVTSNNKEMILTDNHRNNCLRGEVLTENLRTDDYIMLNSSKLIKDFNEIFELNNEVLTYNQGFVIGLWLNCGSLSIFKNNIKSIKFNLNNNSIWVKNIIKCCMDEMNISTKINVAKDGDNVYLNIDSFQLWYLINSFIKITRYEDDISSKELDLNCISYSNDFNEGILDGYFSLDSVDDNDETPRIDFGVFKNRNDAETLDAIATTLGYITYIEECNNKWILTVLDKQDIRRNCDNFNFKFANNSFYVKIKSIERIYDYEDSVYCFQMDDITDDKFTLPNGIHNYNCRLRNELSENTFNPTTGLTGVMTGSCNVITLNINRIIQDCVKAYGLHGGWEENTSFIKEYIINILERVYKYHIAYKTMLYDLEDKGMFAASNGGYISISKLYSTVGINGLNEAARFLGLEVSNNPDYIKFLQLILGTIKEQNKIHSIHDSKRPFLFNSEVVPRLSGHVKPFLIDLELLS